MLYSMKDVCKKTGMTYEALKFYCNQGLIPNVKRAENNYRMFDDRDVAWIESLGCLKRCGMSIQEMREYIALCMRGQSSIPERKAILQRKRGQILERIRELEGAVDYIDWKQGFYDGVLAGKIPYESNLLPEGE